MRYKVCVNKVLMSVFLHSGHQPDHPWSIIDCPEIIDRKLDKICGLLRWRVMRWRRGRAQRPEKGSISAEERDRWSEVRPCRCKLSSLRTMVGGSCLITFRQELGREG